MIAVTRQKLVTFGVSPVIGHVVLVVVEVSVTQSLPVLRSTLYATTGRPFVSAGALQESVALVGVTLENMSRLGALGTPLGTALITAP
ncbi:unannotated protein [freshwater metagenome]|uniref:Unannotated protein n=1 Tax=freshwater metagenome TaxID=449393 RepID=A0A6J6M5F3_9ZZZZ